TAKEAASLEWRIGDRVVVANSAPCGQCFYCRNSQENLCDDLVFLNGAYAESIVVPARIVQKNLLRLKTKTDFRDAALVEPLACVVQGIEDTQLKAGQNVLVFGAGPIGLMFVVLAKHLGCQVTVAGRRQRRLKAAHRLGARQVIKIGPEKSYAAVGLNSERERSDEDARSSPSPWGEGWGEGERDRGQELTSFVQLIHQATGATPF